METEKLNEKFIVSSRALLNFFNKILRRDLTYHYTLSFQIKDNTIIVDEFPIITIQVECKNKNSRFVINADSIIKSVEFLKSFSETPIVVKPYDSRFVFYEIMI